MTSCYSVGDAALRLDVSEKTVARMCDAGELHFTRTKGGHRRIDAEAVQAKAGELAPLRDLAWALESEGAVLGQRCCDGTWRKKPALGRRGELTARPRSAGPPVPFEADEDAWLRYGRASRALGALALEHRDALERAYGDEAHRRALGRFQPDDRWRALLVRSSEVPPAEVEAEARRRLAVAERHYAERFFGQTGQRADYLIRDDAVPLAAAA